MDFTKDNWNFWIKKKLIIYVLRTTYGIVNTKPTNHKISFNDVLSIPLAKWKNAKQILNPHFRCCKSFRHINFYPSSLCKTDFIFYYFIIHRLIPHMLLWSLHTSLFTCVWISYMRNMSYLQDHQTIKDPNTTYQANSSRI